MTNASSLEQGAPRTRIFSLRGGCNFRDIGGYRTQHGEHVRWGRVYRAGVLSYFTEEDHTALHGLGVRAICDLRRAEEREREPTRWPGQITPSVFYWDDGTNAPTLRKLAARRSNTARGMFETMIELYRVLPEWMSGRIRGMYECIAHGHLPTIVHCAAGKDRTGVAIAVLLASLGVSRETVIEDYLLTNDAGNFEEFIRSRHAAQLGLADELHPLLAMPADVRQVLLSAHREFIEASFEQIDGLGGLDVFLERIAGITPQTRDRVARELLG